MVKEINATVAKYSKPEMKKYLLALCLATSVWGANREHSALTQTPLTFAESYGVGSYGGNFRPTDDPFYGSGFDVPKAMAPMPDGGMVVAGQVDFPKLYAPFVGNPGTSGRAMGGLSVIGRR